MTSCTGDKWAAWLLQRRHGGDGDRMRAVLARLYPVRDKVLGHLELGEGRVLVDVGCGDGLIAFGALEKYPAGKVIFADISQDLIDHARSLAEEMRVSHRCEFLRTPAEDLSAVADASVDAVTMRSVLIYIADKRRVFNEFYRILKPGGQLSLFEPVNRADPSAPMDIFWGLDMGPVQNLADRITAVYLEIQPPGIDPMLNFDERDLVEHAEDAGFSEIHLNLEVEVKPLRNDPAVNLTWESLLRMAGYPQAPTLGEAIAQTLTPDEAARFTAHLRPKVEAKEGTRRSAAAFLWATK
jgi:ubiquinone/menaquinone biosynthesis C-methylase UbiE